MKRSIKFAFCVLFFLIFVIGCPVDMDDSLLKDRVEFKSEIDNKPVQIEPAKNLEVTTLEDGSIVLSFTGQKTTEISSLYYTINYTLETGEVKKYTIPGNTSGSYNVPFTFSKGTHVNFTVNSCAKLVKIDGEVIDKEVSTTEFTEGATLPDIILSYKILDKGVQLYWDRDIVKKTFSDGEITDNYYFSLVRITRGIEKVIYDKGKDDSFIDYPIGTVSYKLFLKIGDAEVVSNTVTVSPDSALSCPVADITASAAENAYKDGIMVNWKMPELPTELDEDTVYRFKLERSISGEDKWEEVINEYTDVYNKDYGYEKLNDSSFSFSYFDTDVCYNTKYVYRISSLYLLSEGFTIKQSDEPAVTAPSYKRFVPESLNIDFDNSSNSSKEEDTIEEFSIKLTWEFNGETGIKYNGITPEFEITRINEKNGTKSDPICVSIESTSYTDTFSINDSDLFNDAAYSYSIRVKYADDDFSEELVTTELPYEYEGKDPLKQHIKNVTASTDLAGKIKLNWEFRGSGEELFDKNKITYSIYSSETRTGTYTELTGLEVINGTEVVINNLSDGYSSYYKVVSTYIDDEGTPHVDEQISKNEGKTLSSPSSIVVEDGESTSAIKGSFTLVPDASSYKLMYRVKDSEIEWEELSLTDSEFSINSTDLAEEAGTIYEFKLYAVDKEGTLTSTYVTEDGSLFGLANINAKILSDLESETERESRLFTVTWDKILGAQSYSVNVKADGKEIGSGTLNSNATNAVFNSDQFSITNDSILPEDGFDVEITAINKNDESVAKNIGKAIWLYAPTGISASKATSTNTINVSWNSVPKAESYKIYYRHENEESFKEINDLIYSTSYTYSFSDISNGTYPDTYFKVMAISGSHYSKMIEPSAEANLGYVLEVPENVVPKVPDGICTDNKFTVEWTKVRGAEWYIITDEKGSTSKDIIIIADDLSTLENGNVSYTFEDLEMKDEVNWNHEFSVKAGRKVGETEISTLPNTKTFQVYRYLTWFETLNILHTKLNYHLRAADRYFRVDKKEDWWPYSANIFGNGDNSSTYTSNGTDSVTIQNTKGTDAFGHTGESSNQRDSNRGKIVISNLSLGGGISVISKEIKIGVNGSIAGSTNNCLNQLRTTDNPTFTITYPSKFDNNEKPFTSTVNISSHITFVENDGLEGGYTISINGTTNNISYKDYVDMSNSVSLNASY